MSGRPFTAQFPKSPEIGDEVVVKGKLKPDARVFSVNFILPLPPPIQKSLSVPGSVNLISQPCCDQTQQTQNQTAPYIAYHFKTSFLEDGSSVVVQNWKNVVWQRESRAPNLWLTDRLNTFTLIFRFHHEAIKVFVDHTHQSPDYEFEYQVPLERIRTVELWDDVDFVEEVTFRFRNLPKKPAIDDEVVVKGTLKEDAKRFSINLCLARPDSNHPHAEPERIAYHFGLSYSDDGSFCEVIQNCKNSVWGEATTSVDEWFCRRKINLIFRFHMETVKVFVDDTQHPPDYEYEPQYPIEQIQSIELWDDIERLEEITLRFSE